MFVIRTCFRLVLMEIVWTKPLKFFKLSPIEYFSLLLIVRIVYRFLVCLVGVFFCLSVVGSAPRSLFGSCGLSSATSWTFAECTSSVHVLDILFVGNHPHHLSLCFPDSFSTAPLPSSMFMKHGEKWCHRLRRGVSACLSVVILVTRTPADRENCPCAFDAVLELILDCVF